MDKFEMFERSLSHGGDWTDDEITPELVEQYNENIVYLHEQEAAGFPEEERAAMWVIDDYLMSMADVPQFFDNR